MATEYRLSYTAAEIDEKLGMVDAIQGLSLNGTILTIATGKNSFDIDLSPIFDTRNFVYYSDGDTEIGVELSGNTLYIRSGVTVTQSGSALTIGG